MKAALVSVVVLCVLAGVSWGEVRRHYYTDAKLKIVRSNVEKYGWARSRRDALLAGGDRWAKYDDERLLTLVVPPEVPRCYQVHNFGCPVHGIKVHEKGLYKWIVDFDNPWKIKCPVGGELYPSNDFGAFLASGMKDRSLLFNAEHPDPKDPLHKQYVDDGWGWNREGDEMNYWLVAFYAHWSMARLTMPAIRSLGLAAVVADDPEKARVYAHKCALLLWRLAEYYPDYAYEKQSREGKEHNPNYRGKWTNRIWEVQTPNACAPAYDAIRPFLADDTELQERAGLSGEELDEYIRERLLMEAARCTVGPAPRIAANYGTHQRSLLLLALALDEHEKHPTSEEMIEFVVANPKSTANRTMGIRDALENMVYRDGMPLESIGYNYGWVHSLTEVASALTELGVNFFEDRRFQRLIEWGLDVVIAEKFVPPLGDSGNMFAGHRSLSPTVARLALPHWPDPRIANVVRQNLGASRDLFEEPLEETLAQIPEQEMEPVGVKPFLFPAYGLAYLQNGNDSNRNASALLYGNYPAHRHYDQLNMLLFSHGNALLTDIGYPEQTDAFNHKLFAFFTNTVAHNTVVVNARRQGRGPGKLYAYQPAGFVQIVDASADAYLPKVTLYRRVNMLVEVTPTDSYVFDVFYVRGGEQHDYMALGPPSQTSAIPALGPVQAKGTLAGEDVPLQHFYDDERFAAKPLGTMSYGGYQGSGFQYLFSVRRTKWEDRAVFEWRLKEPEPDDTRYPWEGRGLRAHLVGNGEELIAADAKPQKYKSLPQTIQFMMRRRTGEDLASNFVTVYEPYRDRTFINRVSAVSVDPDDGQAVAARIELANGDTHYVFHSLAPEQTYKLDGKVTVTGHAACLVVDENGEPKKAMLLNGTELAIGDFALKSGGMHKTKIASVDYEKGIIEVADPVLRKHSCVGQVAIVAPDTFHDSVTMAGVIDETHFSIGDEDLRVAGGPVSDIEADKSRIVTCVSTPHAQDGMSVLNSLWQVQGRRIGGKPVTLDREGRPALKLADFPAAAGSEQRRFTIVMAAPGDTILIPSLAIVERN